MKITKIEPQKRNPNRVNLYIDDKFEVGLSIELVVDKELKAGDEITEIDLKSLKSESAWQKWVDRILGYIAIRPRTEEEIRRYIKEKLYKYKRLGIEEELISSERLENLAQEEKTELGIKDADVFSDQIIEYLKSKNYLNDAEFVRWYLEQNAYSGKPKGINYIKSDLVARGVDRAVAREVVEENADSGIFDTALKKAVEKAKAKHSKLTDKRERKNKTILYLTRRGFSYGEFKDYVDC